jgi:hypothetical protein
MQTINQAIWFADQRLLLLFQPWNQSALECLGYNHHTPNLFCSRIG